MVKATAGVGTVEVSADGEGLVSHAGVALVVELADLVGLTGALSDALAGMRERRCAHDPGRVLRDVAVMLADGGDSRLATSASFGATGPAPCFDVA